MRRETASQSQKIPDRINSLLNFCLQVQRHMPWIRVCKPRNGKHHWAYTAPFTTGSPLNTRTVVEKERYNTKALIDVRQETPG